MVEVVVAAVGGDEAVILALVDGTGALAELLIESVLSSLMMLSELRLLIVLIELSPLMPRSLRPGR